MGSSADKKARRKERIRAEKAAQHELQSVTDQAVELALAAAPAVADAVLREDRIRVIEVDFPSIDAARFARKRINELFTTGEWLDAVRVHLWQVDADRRKPLSDRGAAAGFELRVEQVRSL